VKSIDYEAMNDDEELKLWDVFHISKMMEEVKNVVEG
jgi:hypothetical protein